MNLARTFRSSLSRVTLRGLNPCLSYWVVVRAEDCVNHIRSAPRAIGLFDAVRFGFNINMGAAPCELWVVSNYARKISDIQGGMNAALEESTSCGMSVPCMASSQFTCGVLALLSEYILLASYIRITIA